MRVIPPIVSHCLATKGKVKKLLATGGVWVIIGQANDEKGVMDQQNSPKISVVVHSTMHLGPHTHCIYVHYLYQKVVILRIA